jgi:FG-GAP-like repeat
MNALRSTATLVAVAALGSLALAGSAPGADDAPVPDASAPIVVGIDSGGGPYVTAYNAAGSWRAGFLPYFDFTQGGINVAAGDVDGTGKADVITAPGRGGRGEIREFDGTGTQEGPTPLATASGCGTRIAAGDLTGDGKADLVTSYEICSSDVQVFDGVTGKRISDFRTFNTNSTVGNGVRVAVGDVSGDRRDEIVVGGGPGDPGTVQIFPGLPSDSAPQPLRTIDAFGPNAPSGVEVAAVDVTGDGKADVIAGAETPDDAVIKIFDGSTGALLDSFHPFGLVTAGTLRVAAGDVDGNGKPDIVVGATTGSIPEIRVFSPDGTKTDDFSAPFYDARSLAVGDVDGDGKAEIEMGSGPSYDASVAIFDATGTLSTSFDPYGYSFTNGVRVAAGDLNGDGRIEYVTGQGPGGSSELLVLDAQGNELRELYPFGKTWQGLYVASGDVSGDGKDDVVAGAGAWEEPRIKVFGGDGQERASFLAFDPDFQGGVRVATGDLQGNGTAEIVAGPGPGEPPVVRVFDESGQRKLSFYAFDPSYTGGIYVAAGDIDGDGKAEIVVGSGTTGEVRVFDANGNLRTTFQAYEASPDFYEGTHVAVGDVNGDGIAEIVTGPGRVRPVDVAIFTGAGQQIGTFRANQDFQGGIYVAVPAALGPRLADAVASPARGTEGHALRLAASFVDPRGGAAPDQFAATVSWGDAGVFPGTVSALGGGRYEITGRHAYDRFGRYPITVRVSDIHLRAVVASTMAFVRDARLAARGRSIRTKGLVFNGFLATVKDTNPAGSSLDLSATVRWGDGTHSSAVIDDNLLSGRVRVAARHRYAKPGVYRAVVRVRSLGGSTARASATIRVG